MTPPEIAQLKELLERLVNHHHNPFEPDNQSRLYVDVLKARDVQFPALLTALKSSQRRVGQMAELVAAYDKAIAEDPMFANSMTDSPFREGAKSVVSDMKKILGEGR